MKKLTLLIWLIMPIMAIAQSTYEYDELDNKPVFKEGNKYLDSFFNVHFNPIEITDSTAEKKGFVNIEVTVNADGTVSGVAIKDDSMYAGFAAECLRVFELIAKDFKYETGDADGEAVKYIKKEHIRFMSCSQAQLGYVYTVNNANETMPQFPGGPGAMEQFVFSNFRVPNEAAEVGASGRVYIEFVVDTSGKMTDIKISKDGAGFGCGEEALRVVKLMGDTYTWTPGQQGGCLVRVRYRYPVIINFGNSPPRSEKKEKKKNKRK